MLLPGSLSSTTLGDLLGTLYRARATGILELVERSGMAAGRAHRVHLDRGLVARVDSPLSVPRLGDLLQSGGFLTARAARRLGEERALSVHRRIGSILLEQGLCTPEIVRAALRHQLRARLDALFQLRDARIGFHVAYARDAGTDTPVPLSPHETLRGRPRTRERTGDATPAVGRRLDSARIRALGVLGLEAGADRAAVQRAFRQLAAEVHPDRHPHATAAEQAVLSRRFSELSAAYHELSA